MNTRPSRLRVSPDAVHRVHRALLRGPATVLQVAAAARLNETSTRNALRILAADGRAGRTSPRLTGPSLWVAIAEPGEPPPPWTPTEAAVLAVVREMESPMTAAEVADLTGTAPAYAARCLRALTAAGVVNHMPRRRPLPSLWAATLEAP